VPKASFICLQKSFQDSLLGANEFVAPRD